jgi:hypothetical protein
MFYCFGCGAGGDAIEFVQQFLNVDFAGAIETITGKLPEPSFAIDTTGSKAPKTVQWQAIQTPPADVPAPKFDHYRLGQPATIWTYRDSDGQAVGYVARFNIQKPDGSQGKETLPMCWAVNTQTGECQWRWQAFATPRPLFGINLLAQNRDAKVMIVEGEKTAEAARRFFKSFVVVSWPGGGKAVHHADWTAIAGRDVVLWPDWDWKTYPDSAEIMPADEQPGMKAMRAVYDQIKATATRVRIVLPMEGAPDGWDLADDFPTDDFQPMQYAKANIVDASEIFNSQNANEPENPEPVAIPSEFGKPVDLFGIVMPPSLPLDVLPEVMQAYVADQSELLGCDHSIVGMASLVAAASCIDDGIRLQPKRLDPTWTESARLWVAFVGDPSTKKTPAISKAVRNVKKIDHRMAEENERAYAEYKFQHESWKEAKKATKEPIPEPPKPQIKRLIVEDITVEALSEVLKDNARGVLCLQDELTGWFASMDAYKGGGKAAGKDRAHWLETYNGGRRSIDRVTRGSLIVPNWSACMIGGIQPDMIRRVSNSMGNDGLMQRFMVICARPAARDKDRTPDMKAMQQFADLFEQLAGTNASPDVVKMTEAAHQSRERVSEYSIRMINAFDSPHMSAWLGKWDGLYARLLLLYHCIDCASRGVYPTDELVSEKNALKVERLLCGTLLHHAIHFYTEILDAHDKQENMRSLARLILARNMTIVTKRDISRLWRASRKLEHWELKDIIDGLSNLDWLAPDHMKIDIDGKPKQWHVNPAVHVQFADYADRERRRRHDVVEAIRELKEQYAPTE